MLESVVLLLVPSADPVVGSWRQRLDPSASQGIPAHITLLYPFLPAGSVGPDVFDQLRKFFAHRSRLELALHEFGRFPGVLYLRPEPDEVLRRLMRDLWALYPDLPPYGGVFEDPTPHLTVAQSVDESTLAEVEREMRADLPIVSSVNEAALMVETATGWRVRERFAMSSPQGVTDAPGQ